MRIFKYNIIELFLNNKQIIMNVIIAAIAICFIIVIYKNNNMKSIFLMYKEYKLNKNYSENGKNPIEQAIIFNPEDEKLSISLQFEIKDFGLYHNILQTGEKNEGLRMEFNSPNDVYWSSQSINKNWESGLVGQGLEFNKLYNLEMVYDHKVVIVKLDGKIASRKRIEHSPSFDEIIIGRGYSPDRYFRGNISNIVITVENVTLAFLLIKIIICGAVLSHIIYTLNTIANYKFLNYIKTLNLIYYIKQPITVLSSLIIFCIIINFSAKALKDFYQYKKFGNAKILLTWENFTIFLNTEFKRIKARILAYPATSDRESPLITYRISVKEKYLKLLNKDLPNSGKLKAYPAFLKASDSNNIFRVKIRYRGDNLWHWLFKQKSLRISFEKNQSYKMRSKINLVNPPYIFGFRDVAAYKISQELGILSPECYPARVFINGEYMGVYLFLDQPDESLLRRNNVMPGSIYYGDDSDDDGKTELTEYGASNLFFDEKRWVKQSNRNAEQKENRNEIIKFIDILSEKNRNEFYKNFEKYFDKEKYFNYMAIDRITGTWMHDMNHNHKIYFDPYKGKFEPIQWDVRHFTTYLEKDRVAYTLLERVQENPILDNEIDKIIYNLYLNNITEKISNIYKNTITAAKMDLLADKYKEGANFGFATKPYTYNEQVAYMENDLKMLKYRENYITNNYIKNDDVKYFCEKIEDNKYLINLYVSGNTAVKVEISALLKNNEIDINKKNHLYKNTLDNIEVLYPGRKIIPNLQRVVYISNRKVVPTTEVYEFIITSSHIDDALKKINIYNYITNEKIFATEIKAKLKRECTSIHPWKIKKLKKETKILSGSIIISEDTIVDKEINTIIMPGTRILFNPNKSIYFYGKVVANGTKEDPIIFDSNIIGKKWGSVVLQGNNCSGSLFKYCRIKNGSIAEHSMIKYTSPFNIHDVKDFTVENCYIGKNYLGDDAMHVAYAKSGIIKNNFYENSLMDALDIDISNLIVEGNIFNNIGNDAIDIMTSTVNVNNNTLINTKDKGVSIGEKSDVKLSSNFFINNYIGIEVKDNSLAYSKKSLIINPKKYAINLYHKNKRYDKGGTLTADDTVILGNNKVENDEQSKINLNNTIFDSIEGFNKYINLERKQIPVSTYIYLINELKDLYKKAQN